MKKRLAQAGVVLWVLVFLGAPFEAAAITPTPTPTPSPTPEPTPTPTPPLMEIPVSASGVSASTHDGNLPANVIDGNLATRWAGYGDGAWLRFNLSGASPARTIAQVKIAVYRGHERRNRFDLQVSQDGTVWTNVLTNALTSGTTTLEETFDIPDVRAPFIRYVGHGSSVGQWNSLTEVSLMTYRAAPTCTVTVSPTSAAVGDPVVVSAQSNLGIGRWRLNVIDAATGALQDEVNPIFAPARPPEASGSFNVSWTLTAARPGTAIMRVGVNGEIHDPACSCFYFTNASGQSGPVTVTGDPTPVTPTPTPTGTPTPTPTPTATQPAPPTELHLPASAATASTRDENVPANVVDNSLLTRWSGYGDGAWLKLDLGALRTVAQVKVATHRGHERRNRFELQVSSDQMTWSTVWSGESSGTTSAEETYEFSDRTTRYLRYLGHGNSDPTKAGWNSVNEISVFVVP